MKLGFDACTVFACIGYREVIHGAVLMYLVLLD